MKEDYIAFMPKPNVRTALHNLAVAIEHYNENHPHSALGGNDSNLLIVFYVQIMPDDFVMQLHRF